MKPIPSFWDLNGLAPPVDPSVCCEQTSHNGELAHAVEGGVLTRNDVTQLGDVLAGTATGREADDDITTFDSTGLAIQDLAVALAAMGRAGELDLQTITL